MVRSARKTQPQLRPSAWLWWGIWLVFYALILLLSIFAYQSLTLNIIKVSSILGCLIYASINFPCDYLLQITLATTFLADVLLAFASNVIYGVAAFLVVQCLHFGRITKKYRFAICYALVALLATFIGKFELFSQTVAPIMILCVFYVIIILLNIKMAQTWRKQRPRDPAANYAIYGFLLFLACDICVAMSYLTTNGILSANLTLIFNFLAWFFYYPSQILVSNSAKCDTIE